MRKRQISIVGGFYKDPNLHWSRQDTLNWIPVRAEQAGTLTPFQLRDAPGVKPYVRITRDLGVDGIVESGAIRGMRNVEGKLFVVSGNTLYQISNTGVAIPYGTIPGVGRVSMSHNQQGLGNQLTIVNGSSGYVFNTSTLVLAKITDNGYPGAFIADYIDQYIAQIEPQGRYWFHSDLADALSYNTLDQYEAEADPDRIVSLVVSHREVLVFGRDTIEPFVNTGSQTGTFERASNTVIEVGCSAKFTPRKLDNSVFWLDDKRLIRRLDGYTPIRISTDAIDSAFSECSDAEIAQSYAFTWETRGHKVYYITVPGRFTFGYDVLTGQIHRRATFGFPHWCVTDAVFWNGRWIVGDSRYGRLYELDQDYKLDSCDPLVRQRITGKLWDDENDMTLNNVELKFNTGGVVSECVAFPTQPIGPSISGAAPDGSIGLAYAGYQYTVIEGDAAIVSVSIFLGSLPPGLTISNTGLISSTEPTQIGSFTYTVRVTDANGLYAEVIDTVLISVGPMLVLGLAASSTNLISSLDGTQWSPLIDPVGIGSPSKIYGLDDFRFLAVTGGATNSRYSDDIGETWSVTTLATQAANFGRAVVLSDCSLASGIAGINRTTDNGETWSVVGPLVPIVSMSGFDELVCALTSETRPTYSTDRGVTWSDPGPRLDTVLTPDLSFDLCSGTDGETIYFGGSSSTGMPVVAYTTNGIDFVSDELPGGVARNVTALCFAENIGENGTWIAGCSDGTLYRWSGLPSSAVICADSLGVNCQGIIYNGLVVVAAGGNLGAGVIKSSANADNWTTRTQLLTQEILHLAQGMP